MSLAPATIAIVKATAPVVGAHAREITNLFYKTMFANNPEVLTFFNRANQVSLTLSVAALLVIIN